MSSRHTVILSLLVQLPAVVLAQDMHVFSNGTVADADKINENFAAIDQEGPTITFSERQVAANGVDGTVTVTVTDSSGVFSWGLPSNCCAEGSPFKVLDEFIVFEPDGPIVSTQTVGAGYNSTSSLVVSATDVRGNKSVKKVDYTGPSTVIKRGNYRTDNPFTWSMGPCGGEQMDFPADGVRVELHSTDFVYPQIGVVAYVCAFDTSGYCSPGVPIIMGTDPTAVAMGAGDQSIDQLLELSDGETETTIALSGDGSSMDLTLKTTVQCSGTEVVYGPKSLSLEYDSGD